MYPNLESQDRPLDRFVPQINTFRGAYGMNSRTPDLDNLQAHLKTTQDECQRLSEENAHLRAVLGINQSHSHDLVANITEPFGLKPNNCRVIWPYLHRLLTCCHINVNADEG
jgi:hypothetical protein